MLSWALGLPPVWAAAAVPLGGLLWRLLERRLDTEWLLRLYAFTCAQGEDQLPDLDARLDALADALLAQARAHPAHELLVVGHSTGAIQAAAVLARALQRGPDLPRCARHLGLLTLGHCTPLLAWQPRAAGFVPSWHGWRKPPELTWWDFTAPADWAAFAQVAPWTEAGGPARRHATSPRFHQTMSGPPMPR
jgi:pimeloyl-ACP methyl ester carboxylesterase